MIDKPLRFASPLAVLGLIAMAACSRPATQAAATAPATTAPAATIPPVTPASTVAAASGPTPASGYSCSFPGPDGRSILARFTVQGATAHDDQGMPFTVLTDSPTALVLAHARDDSAATPAGDVGAYLVAIDRRSLGMVQSTVGLNGRDATRRGRCIVG